MPFALGHRQAVHVRIDAAPEDRVPVDQQVAGCRSLIEKIDRSRFDIKILPIQDKYRKDWGVLKIKYVQVKRLTQSNG